MTLIPVTVRSSSENGSAQLFKSGPALGADADGEHFVGSFFFRTFSQSAQFSRS